MSDAVLEISGLCVSYAAPNGGRAQVLHDLSLRVGAGEVLALVGESGSGKTTTAQAVIGLLAQGARIDAGSIRLLGQEMTTRGERALNSIRGRVVSLIPQDPGASLNPVRTIGAQVCEVLAAHGVPRVLRRDQAIGLLARVGLSEPARRFGQYPHELSGGMKQRVLIAIAIALEPALIIADEPTSALDVTVQRRILDLIDDLRRNTGTAVLLVTHDLAVAADRADRIVVLKSGRVQEQGAVDDVLRAPASAYARQLLADAPAFAAARLRPEPVGRDIAVRVEDLRVEFAQRGAQKFRAVDGLSFSVPRGTTHAIVGESGSGKTSAMRAIVGLARPTSGRVVIGGHEITAQRGEDLRQFRRRCLVGKDNVLLSPAP